jgi:hypothetical protein
MAPRLALWVAVPLAFVGPPLPAALPFSVKLIVCPLTPTAGEPDVRVADKFTDCPKTPVIGLVDRLVVF